jgi:hypothetical protein
VVGYSAGLLDVASDKEGGLCAEEIGADIAVMYVSVGVTVSLYALYNAAGGSCPHFLYIPLSSWSSSASSLSHRGLWGSWLGVYRSGAGRVDLYALVGR